MDIVGSRSLFSKCGIDVLEPSFLSWSLSFYPQPLLNWRRKSTYGLLIDFPTLNVLGFFCYSISTTSFLYSPLIRQQYATRNPLAPESTVRFNDVAFAIHALTLCLITYSQFWPKLWGFKCGKTQRMSRPIAGVFWGGILAVVISISLVLLTGKDAGQDPRKWAWIDVVRTLTVVDLSRRLIWSRSMRFLG